MSSTMGQKVKMEREEAPTLVAGSQWTRCPQGSTAKGISAWMLLDGDEQEHVEELEQRQCSMKPETRRLERSRCPYRHRDGPRRALQGLLQTQRP